MPALASAWLGTSSASSANTLAALLVLISGCILYSRLAWLPSPADAAAEGGTDEPLSPPAAPPKVPPRTKVKGARLAPAVPAVPGRPSRCSSRYSASTDAACPASARSLASLSSFSFWNLDFAAGPAARRMIGFRCIVAFRLGDASVPGMVAGTAGRCSSGGYRHKSEDCERNAAEQIIATLPGFLLWTKFYHNPLLSVVALEFFPTEGTGRVTRHGPLARVTQDAEFSLLLRYSVTLVT